MLTWLISALYQHCTIVNLSDFALDKVDKPRRCLLVLTQAFLPTQVPFGTEGFHSKCHSSSVVLYLNGFQHYLEGIIFEVNITIIPQLQ